MAVAGAVSEQGFAALNAARATDENLTEELKVKYGNMVAEMRAVFETGRTKSVEWRKHQLRSFISGAKANKDEIVAALLKDLGGPKLRGVADLLPIIGDAEYNLKMVDKWAAPQFPAATEPLPLTLGSTASMRPEPKGVTLNIAPWNFPFAMCFQPLASAIAAGCPMVIKPSELAPACAEVIKKIVDNYLDNDCYKVELGAVPETTALLAQKWDHIFYTGNGSIARLVMDAAAKHLTPMTLELGGKSPVLIDSTAKVDVAVNRIFYAKNLNCGQICIAPDYVLVHESKADEFVQKFVGQIQKSYGSNSKGHEHWGNIINSRHCERLRRLIETSGGEVLCGGVQQIDAEARHVPLTVIKNPEMDSPVMNEEVFGPVLPVFVVKDMNQAINVVKEKERPLALYLFSEDQKWIENVLSTCTSGGACVNSCLEQIAANKELPFGGTGASGFGKYHGRFGFEEFSHIRAVLYKSTMTSTAILPPPELCPPWLYDVAMKVLVTGFISDDTREKLEGLKKVGGVAVAAAVAAMLFSRSRL
jgi:aldehyde dehydrogenase (NAD+)